MRGRVGNNEAVARRLAGKNKKDNKPCDACRKDLGEDILDGPLDAG